MRNWDLNAIEVEVTKPVVLDSESEGRTIAIQLGEGDTMGEHQVHERAWLVVISGEIELASADGGTVSGGPGLLAQWEPAERHEVRALKDSRLLLLLAPWPGDGHPSAAERAG